MYKDGDPHEGGIYSDDTSLNKKMHVLLKEVGLGIYPLKNEYCP